MKRVRGRTSRDDRGGVVDGERTGEGIFNLLSVSCGYFWDMQCITNRPIEGGNRCKESR